jgi:ribosome-interacting GTPase 1
VRPEGAAQIALIGPPNSGKSLLHSRLTGSSSEVGPYPHTTTAPIPGMLAYEDIQLQLIDLPPIATDYMESWMPNALQLADAALLVVDLHVPGCVENVVAIRERLTEKRISLVDDWGERLPAGLICPPAAGQDEGASGDEGGEPAPDRSAPDARRDTAPASAAEPEGDIALDDPFRTFLPALLIISKCDQGIDPEEVDLLEELVGQSYPALCVSATSGEGLDKVGQALFYGLGIVRVYTKAPGKEPDTGRPYTVLAGGTVADVAALIHRDLAASIKYARVWGSAKFDGQQVGKDYRVCDGDIVELHD